MNHAVRRLSALLLLIAALALSACDNGTSAVPKSRAGTPPERPSVFAFAVSSWRASRRPAPRRK